MEQKQENLLNYIKIKTAPALPKQRRRPHSERMSNS